MKLTTLSSLFCLLAVTPCFAQTPPVTPPTVVQTVGVGSNESFFVINFNDGAKNTDNPASDFKFGYFWNYGANNATPTGEDFLASLQQGTSNPQLQVNQTYYASFNEHFVNGFTYGTASQTGYYHSQADNASWVYWGSTASRLSQNSSDWDEIPTGPDQRPLAPNSYDGWTYNVVAPAPEPSAGCVLALGAGALALAAVRRRRQA